MSHLLYLTEREFSDENSGTSADEIAASEQLFEVLKSFKDSHFSVLDVYQTLDFGDEYDETTDEEETIDDTDDLNENQRRNIHNHFTLEEMEEIIEWVDQHPNYKFSTIIHKFQKVKYPIYISTFREYIRNNGTIFEKLEKIKQFMWDEFYVKRAVEKEAIHDTDLERFAYQKAIELNGDNFKVSESFLTMFKKENRISSRRYNKLITRVSSTRKDARNWVKNQKSLISNYSPEQILTSDHCSFQQEYISPRTLSFMGERTTKVAVKKKNNVTHSYTVQSITSAVSQLLDKFLLILQEKEKEFGKRVQRDLIVPPNVVVQASKSGKSSDEKHRIFLNEILRPLIGRKFLLFLEESNVFVSFMEVLS
ncbi:unnamed protein product [Rotaria magnacalcarata]|nr:unnamed protein product [Rotaria magnacalcarata]CAF1656011.1 unnamed protein product [Rotaria magnacalcarata]CAF1937629.1 unnamed protein product [Rotaria magnacalcarata]CAF2099787.1 unnamed protein product [Rotaria magnacalcarata]CAF4015183.1 unnamed protein product [Rotaria magnacalcarata]